MEQQQPAPGRDARQAGLGALAALPDELLCYLLHSLGVPELLALSQASRLLRVLVCEEPLWLQKHLDRCSQPFDYRGSWRATYIAHHPACRRPQLTPAELAPLALVPGFSSMVLYRRWYRCHVDLSSFLPELPAFNGTPPLSAAATGDTEAAAAGSSGGGCGTVDTPAASGVLSPAAAAGGGAGPAAAAGAGPPAAVGAGSSSSSSIPYIKDAMQMSAEEFEARYDQPRQPVVLGGLAASWAGGSLEAWKPAALATCFGDRLIKVSKPFLAGGRTKMRLADYLSYAQQQHDEEPLYVFDASFGEAVPELLRQYSMPHIFRHDMLACLGYRREDYRWLVAGPARSGASWHVDPTATSAWNALLAGRKRWALYPPGRVPPGVTVNIDADGSPSFEAPTSLQWYLEIYPHLLPDQRPLEVVQQAGDTIFLPAGWWHCVLNLELTVAVTQNFVSPANLEAAVQWMALGAGSMFDPLLVPAYLRRQQQGQQREGQQQQGGEVILQPESQPAKRRRTQQQQQPPSHSKTNLVGRRQAGQQPGEGDEEAAAAEAAALEAAAAAAAEAAAEAHLQELPLGFARDGPLGPWLRLLLLQLARQQQQGQQEGEEQRPQPGTEQQQQQQQRQGIQQGQQALVGERRPQQQQLLERVWQLAQQWGDLQAWQPRLAAACRAVELPLPQQCHEWLPLATGWCVVFEVGGAIIKFYNSGTAPHAIAMGCIEAAAYLSMAAAGTAGTGAAGAAAAQAAGAAPAQAPAPACNDGSGSSSSRMVGSGSGICLFGTGLLEGTASSSKGGGGGGAGMLEASPQPAAEAAAAAEPHATGAAPAAQAAAAAAAAKAEPAEVAALPFIVIKKVPGVTLGSCMDSLTQQRWLAVAAAAGRGLARFHSLPLPAAAAAGAPAGAMDAAAAAAGNCGSNCTGVCTAWVGRDGIVYSSTAGTLDMRQEEQGQQQQQLLQQQHQALRLFPAVAALLQQQGTAGGGSSSGGDGSTIGQQQQQALAEPADHSPEAAATASGSSSCSCCSCPRCRTWQPFVSFLRRQRRRVKKVQERDGSLPPQLLQLLDSYLPADPAVLVGQAPCSHCNSRAGAAAATAAHQLGSGGSADVNKAAVAAVAGMPAASSQPAAPTACCCCSSSSGGSMPTWVHGDLTAENLLVSGKLGEQQQEKQQQEEQQHHAANTHQPGQQQQGQQQQQQAGQQQGQQQQQQAGQQQGQGQEQQQQAGQRQADAEVALTLIDFADSGHGDPLWDFVPLMLRTLRSVPLAMAACLEAYCAALPPAAAAPPTDAATAHPGSSMAAAAAAAAAALGAAQPACWPPRPALGGASASYAAPPPGSLAAPAAAAFLQPACWPPRPGGASASYVALCYTLLHELAPGKDVFKRRPELWEAGGWGEVQQAVWGWLDEGLVRQQQQQERQQQRW